jgi:hypothetical protein
VNKPPANSPAPLSRDDASSTDATPGVPGFRTWRGVYLFVFGCFVAVVIALTIFSRVFA